MWVVALGNVQMFHAAVVFKTPVCTALLDSVMSPILYPSVIVFG